ncbi:hypothetical protein B0H13DRAFT_1923423 [Mycena leptocephala]|nr:hypothetical protein B0H13DRAFT_1923423 [Mycena leptocephala]
MTTAMRTEKRDRHKLERETERRREKRERETCSPHASALGLKSIRWRLDYACQYTTGGRVHGPARAGAWARASKLQDPDMSSRTERRGRMGGTGTWTEERRAGEDCDADWDWDTSTTTRRIRHNERGRQERRPEEEERTGPGEVTVGLRTGQEGQNEASEEAGAEALSLSCASRDCHVAFAAEGCYKIFAFCTRSTKIFVQIWSSSSYPLQISSEIAACCPGHISPRNARSFFVEEITELESVHTSKKSNGPSSELGTKLRLVAGEI